jgi:phospholipid/cholesterol/gamma-HCH transport system substrate-binding protein
VTQSIDSVLNKQNQQWISDSLQNIQRITQTLAVNSEQMSEILNHTAKASRDLGPLLESSASTMRMLQNQTMPEAYQLLSNLNDITRTLSDVSLQIKQNPAVLVRGAAPQPLGPGETK